MLDLTSDNRIPALLDERAALKAGIDANQKRIKDIDAEIVAKLGGAEEAKAAGWAITYKLQVRKEHVVKETIFAVLRATRTGQPALAA